MWACLQDKVKNPVRISPVRRDVSPCHLTKCNKLSPSCHVVDREVHVIITLYFLVLMWRIYMACNSTPLSHPVCYLQSRPCPRVQTHHPICSHFITPLLVSLDLSSSCVSLPSGTHVPIVRSLLSIHSTCIIHVHLCHLTCMFIGGKGITVIGSPTLNLSPLSFLTSVFFICLGLKGIKSYILDHSFTLFGGHQKLQLLTLLVVFVLGLKRSK